VSGNFEREYLGNGCEWEADILHGSREGSN
jgi:hypothetical protein